MGTGPVHLRRAREGLALGGQEESELLGQGQALPGRLPRASSSRPPSAQVAAIRGERAHIQFRGFTPGGPRQPQGRARRQDHGAGEPVGLHPAGGHEPQEEAVRRQAGAPRAHARARPLRGLQGAVQDRHRQGSRRGAGARDALRDAARRAGKAGRLRQATSTLARRGTEAPQGGGRAEGFSFTLQEPRHPDAVRAARPCG